MSGGRIRKLRNSPIDSLKQTYIRSIKTESLAEPS